MRLFAVTHPIYTSSPGGIDAWLEQRGLRKLEPVGSFASGARTVGARALPLAPNQTSLIT